MNQLAVVSALLGVALCASSGSAADSPAPDAELKALRNEIGELRKGQQAIGNDVAEIRKILESLKGPAPVRTVEGVMDLADSPRKGSEKARVTLIEFSDYQCPFCRRHAEKTLPQLEKEYVATGKVRYVFRDYPLDQIHPDARKAAEAAHCAGEQGRYWPMHDKLFASQKALSTEKLVEQARMLGVKMDRFEACLKSGRYADRIRKDVAAGEKLSMTGTPTVLIGTSDGNRVKLSTIMVGAQPFSLYKDAIDKLLAAKPSSK